MTLFKSKSSVELLQEKSKNIIDIFTKTASQLDDVNTSIAIEIAAKEEIKKVLEAEIVTLDGQAAVNSKISANIKAILS